MRSSKLRAIRTNREKLGLPLIKLSRIFTAHSRWFHTPIDRVQLPLELTVHIPHVVVVALQAAQIIRAELRVRVGQVHREGVGRDVEAIPCGAEVLEELHLVVPVVHKPLVEQRRAVRVPQQHVGLLEVGEEAADPHEGDIGGNGEPVRRHVQLEVRRFPRADVRADAGLGGEAGSREEAGLEGGLVGGEELEREQRAVEEAVAAVEDLLAVEEEDGEDGGDVAAVQRGREAQQLAVGVEGGQEVHVEDLEVRRADVADAEVAEQVDGEEAALRHQIEQNREALGEEVRAEIVQERLLLVHHAVQHQHQRPTSHAAPSRTPPSGTAAAAASPGGCASSRTRPSRRTARPSRGTGLRLTAAARADRTSRCRS